MANVLYDTGRDSFLRGSYSWLTSPMRVQLISISNQPTAYVFNASLDTVFASVPTGSRVGFSMASVGSKTATAGIADGADTVFSAVSGPTVGAIIITASTATANASDWQLVAYIDTATGMPVGPNGGDITVQWDNAANKIFKL
jgi:hypothetical protein